MIVVGAVIICLGVAVIVFRKPFMFTFPVGQTFPLQDIAQAHRVGESGRVRGKLVLLVE